ncbi:MAG: T9SS type A sorting domain-containing protein [Paludibacter sp.]|nr:T9SS type A sorting domain-containing protein [Paludibacter sp.]
MVRLFTDNPSKKYTFNAVVKRLAMALFVSGNTERVDLRAEFKAGKSLIFCLLVFVVGVVNATNYYSAGNNDPNTNTNWWTGTNGTGSHPANFTTNGNVFIIQNGHTMTTTANWTVSGTSSTIQINTGGTLIASNAVTATIMTVASGATYQHNINGGTIPTATWDAASNCNITGVVGNIPTGIDQIFGNFLYNCPNQSGTENFAPTEIDGNLQIINTGGQQLRLTINSLTIYGNCSISDNFRVASNTSRTLNILGSFTLNSGTLDLSSGSGIGTLNVTGDFNIYGGSLTESGSASGNIVFNKTGAQSFAKTAGTISQIINFTVNNGAILDVGTSIINGSTGTFTLSSGAGIITAHAQGLSTTTNTGSIQVTGTKTYNNGANYTYNGIANQVTGNGLTGANNLTLNNSAGLTLSQNVTINGILTFTNGKITTGSSTLIMGNSASVSGAGTGKYIFGNLQKGIASSTVSKNFEIGDNSNYTPVSLNFSGTATNGTGSITISTTALDHPNIGSSTIPAALSVNRYWTLVNTGVTFGTYAATFNFVSGDLDSGIDYNSFYVGRYTPSTWTYPAVGTKASTSTQITGLTQTLFGDFQLGQACVNPTLFSLTGGGIYCSGGIGMPVGLSSSENGVTYQLYLAGNPVGSAVSGTGSSISFGNQTTAGTYTVVGTRTIGGCSTTMTGSAIVSINVSVPDFTGTITNTTCPSSTNGAVNISIQTPIEFASTNNNYIDLGRTLLSNRAMFTIEGWVKFNKSDIGSRMSLFGQNDAIEFGFSDANTIQCWTSSGGSVSTSITNYPNDNGWHHIAVVGNGTNLLIYIDGVQVGTGGSTTVNYSNNTSYTTKIGGAVWDATGGSFTGQIKKIGIYNTALTSGQLFTLASSSSVYTGSETGILAGYNFLEGSGSTLSCLPVGTGGSFTNAPLWKDGMTYSWTKTGDGTFNQSIKNINSLTPGIYNLSVANGTCTKNNSFTVNSINSIISISSQSTGGQTQIIGSSFTPITVSASGSGISYQWYSNAVAVNTGGTSLGSTNGALTNSYSPQSTTVGTLYYYCIVSGTCSSVTSNVSGAFVVNPLTPTITTSTGTLSGFTYVEGLGPSSEQSFTVSGNNLTTNIIVTPSADFEISTGSGLSFIPVSQITLNVSNATVSATTIYTRMKAGILISALVGPEDITATSSGASSKTVACSGSVIIAPTILPDQTALAFNYNFGSGPSANQSFNVSGSNLTGNIVITPPANYQISLASGSGFASSPITLTQSGGNVVSTPVYVRLIADLVVNTYSGNIALSSSNAITQNVLCTGTVTSPIVTVSTFNLAGFIYTFGSGPSASQFVSVSGTNLTGNITVTAPANFEISTDKTTWSSSIPLSPTNGIVNVTKIYVRLITGKAVGTYGPLNLTAVSAGAIQQNVSCSGQVVNSATVISSVSVLNGFMYLVGTGPSDSQTFTVSGASLTTGITITPSGNFEISNDFGLTYSTGPLTVPKPAGTTINPTIIYVRLKDLLSVTSYSGNLGITSGTAAPVNIACNGQVLDVPGIIAGATPGTSLCIGNTATLNSTPSAGVTNLFWTGPNSYYSQAANPPLPLTGVLSAANAGIYTVTGNVLSGVNLLTNGDFESGNVGFGSSYGYVVPSTNALGPEGLYTIIGDSPFTTPNNVHNNDGGFGNCQDHTHIAVPAAKHQMVINGAPTAGVIVWSESVSVVSGADYEFSYFIQSVNPTAPSILQLYVNGVPAGPMYTASSSTCTWSRFVYDTNAGTNKILQLTLINQNTAAGGNDFALDDLMFQRVFSVQASVNMIVNPVLAPSLLVTASTGNTVFTGTNVTFTATPTNGGTTPTYQWSVGGVTVLGATSSTYSFIPTNGQVVSCVMTSSLPCASPSTATSSVTMTVNQRSNFWIGSIGVNGTDWGNVTNWSGGFIPIPGNDVEYATAANNSGNPALRDLVLDQDRTIGSLVNASNKRLIIPAGKGLIVNNNILTNNADSLIHIVSNSTTANGSLIFHNSAGFPVHATVEMYSKAFYNANGGLNNKYHWQYFGIPLNSIKASPTFDGSYVRRWDESGDSITNHWKALNNESILQPFLGYEITQKVDVGKTIYFEGQLVNTDFSSGQLAVTPTALYPGQHIFANPYAAAIDIRQLTFGPQTEATVYIYNTGSFDDWSQIGGADNRGNNAGQYTAVPKNTAGDLGVPRQVPSMQAMLIKAMNNSSDATFGISYNSVVMNNFDQQRVKVFYNDKTDKVCTMIDVTGAHYSDRMWLFSQPGCTRNFDNGWDGSKMPGIALTPQIFAIESDGNYQVNAVDDINNSQIGFQPGQDTEYTLTFTHQNIKSRYESVYLYDIFVNKIVDITESGSTYSFTAESSPASQKRFIIVARNIENNPIGNETQLKAFTSGNTVFVQNSSKLNGEMSLYDMMGHRVRKVTFGPYGVTAMQVGTICGAYIVKASTANEKVSKKFIIGK